MKQRILYIIPCLAFLMMVSCAKEVSQEELIEAAVQLKIEQWKTAQLNDCRQKTYNKAEAYVDSLLVVMSLGTKLDTIPKPSKPIKPPKPSFKTKPDSVIIEEIYETN